MKRHFATIISLAIGITLQAQTVLFSETFSNCNGTGGNDDKWSGSIASSDFYSATIYQEDNVTVKTQCSADNEGWELENGNAANECIKLGKGSALGKAKTPVLSNIPSGGATLSFRAGSWNSQNESTTINISVAEGSAKLSSDQVELSKGQFDTYKITISEATDDLRLSISANVKTNNRFFLDDIVITSIDEEGGGEGGEEKEGEESEDPEEPENPQEPITESVEIPTYSVDGGLFTEPFTLKLSAEDGCNIYYTTNDSIPTAESNLYSEPLTIDKSVAIKAIAISQSGTSSEVAEASYFILNKEDRDTIDFSLYGYSNAQAIDSTAGNSEVIFFSHTKSSKPAYYDTGKAVRLYSGSSLTVKSAWNIIAIQITYSGNSYVAKEENTEVSEGSEYVFETHRWNIGGKEATLSFTATSGQLRIAKMEFIYVVEAPTFGTESGTVKRGTKIAIVSEEGNDIYYTTDGTEPTEESTKYSNPIVVREDMTIKAIACDGKGNVSKTVSETYIINKYTTVEEAKEAGDNETIELKLINAIVSKITDRGCYATDETGSIFIAIPELISRVKSGDIINGTTEVEYTIVNGVHTVIASENTSIDALTITEGEKTGIIDADLSDIFDSDLTEAYVFIKGYVKMQDESSYYLVEDIDDGIEYGVTLQNFFDIDFNFAVNEYIEIKGIVKYDNIKFELLPLSVYQNKTSITGIKEMPNSNECYNILGQKVRNNYRGIVIQKGRKCINK